MRSICILILLFANCLSGWQPTFAQSAKQSGKAYILQAYEITQKAGEEDMEAFGKVLSLCQQGLDAKIDADTTLYAKKLMSWAYNRRGEVLAKANKDAEAFTEFNLAVELDETRWRAWHNRGVSQAISGKFQEAYNDFSKTLELQKEYPNAWFNRGEVLYEMGKYEDALKDYNEAVRINAADAEYLTSRGQTQFRMGHLKEALADYEQALKVDPQFVDAMVLRGNALFQTGQYEAAAADYRQAIKLQANHLQGLVNLAWMMSTCPDDRFLQPELAVQAAEKARKLAGDKVDYRLADVLAASLASQGTYSEAIKVLEAAIPQFPEEFKAAAEQRLGLYKSNKPYREPTPPKPQS